MTLYERLRDAPAVCMIPLQGGVGTPTVGLTERERAAVLNLIEAARQRSDEDGFCVICLGSRLPSSGGFEHEPDCAVAVFVSGQEAVGQKEPK